MSMKRLVLFTIVGFLAVGAAQGAEYTANPNPPTVSTGGPYVPDLPNITQSVDPTTVVGGSIACSSGGISADNHFLRRFFLNTDHGIAVQYNVTSVDMGIESVNVYVGTTAPIQVNLFSIANGAGFTFANMGSAIGTVTRTFPDGVSLVVENFPVTGSILDPVGEDLVVEMFYDDVTATGDYGIWPGSNSAGETRPGYIASVGCATPEPATLASLGFSDMHLVMTVNGDEQVVPTATPSGAGEPVPAMSGYGIFLMIALLVGVAVLIMWRRG
jgi:hypothetical protein